MDQQKSWRWVILAYGGVVALIAVVTIFIVRGASHADVVLTNGASTPTPTVDVFHGIRPDAAAPLIQATPVQVAASASPTPGASPSASPSTSPSPGTKALAAAKHAVKKKHGGRPTTIADADSAELANAVVGEPAQEPSPIAHAVVPTEATAAPSQAPVAVTAPPVVAAAAAPAPDDNAPIYAPERIVDAQVRVAVQPDFPETDRERGEHGTSVVFVTIDPKGNVVKASVGTSSGYPGLDRAAVAAARASQFVAPRINGRPATETYRVVYDFTQ